MKLLF